MRWSRRSTRETVLGETCAASAMSTIVTGRPCSIAPFWSRICGTGRSAPLRANVAPHGMADGAAAQELQLRKAHDNANAKLVAAMTDVPSAVWLTQGTPAEVSKQVRDVIKKATGHHTVPVLVAYNVPGRDCGLYSAGGAQTT